MRILTVIAMAVLAVAGSAAMAASLRMTGTFAPPNPQVAQFRTLGIDRFTGRDGKALEFELERRLTKDVKGEPAWFALLADGSAPDGIVRGNASSSVTEMPFTRTEDVCVAKTAGKCTSKVPQLVNCLRRIIEFSGDISVVDNVSGQIVYSNRFPRRNEDVWCGAQQPPSTIAQSIQWMAEDVAKEFRKATTPRIDDYSVRLMESTSGMDPATKAAFKAALKQIRNSPGEACRTFDDLSVSSPNNAAIAYNVAVCDENSRMYELAVEHYMRARDLSGGSRDAAEGLQRVARLREAESLAQNR